MIYLTEDRGYDCRHESCMGKLPETDDDLWDEMMEDRGLESWTSTMTN